MRYYCPYSLVSVIIAVMTERAATAEDNWTDTLCRQVDLDRILRGRRD